MPYTLACYEHVFCKLLCTSSGYTKELHGHMLHRPPQKPQKPCQTTHAADTKRAPERLQLIMLPGKEPWTGHAIELQYWHDRCDLHSHAYGHSICDEHVCVPHVVVLCLLRPKQKRLQYSLGAQYPRCNLHLEAFKYPICLLRLSES